MRDWLATLEPRERLVVLIGMALATAIVFWGGLWNPLSNGAGELDESVTAKRALLTSLQRARSVPTAGGIPAADPARQSLVLLVDQTHRNFGLEGALARNQPDGSDGIRVTFQNAAFDALIAWLGALDSEYGAAVETATIDGGRNPGIVNATVVLRR